MTKYYKFSEMWRAWYVLANNSGYHCTPPHDTKAGAKAYWAQICDHPQLVAITRADATEFFEGEGL